MCTHLFWVVKYPCILVIFQIHCPFIVRCGTTEEVTLPIHSPYEKVLINVLFFSAFALQGLVAIANV